MHEKEPEILQAKVTQIDNALQQVREISQALGSEGGIERLSLNVSSPLEILSRTNRIGQIRKVIESRTIPRLRAHREIVLGQIDQSPQLPTNAIYEMESISHLSQQGYLSAEEQERVQQAKQDYLDQLTKPQVRNIEIDEEAKWLKINGEVATLLSPIEFALVKPLILGNGEPISSKILDDLAIDAGSGGMSSAVAPTLRRIEKKLGLELFGRLGAGRQSAWFLITEKPEPSPDEPGSITQKPTTTTTQKGNIAAIALRPSTEVAITPEVSLANRIIDLVPEEVARLWSETGQLSPEQYQTQAVELTNLVLRIKEGQEQPIQAINILSASSDQKPVIAQSAIKQALAQMILAVEHQPLSAYKYRWGRQIRELADWLGANAKQSLIEAIETLPEVERALVFDVSSINLLKDLDFIDLEECDEFRFAAYLRGATFIRENDLRDDTVEEMIVTAIERDGEGNLDIASVIQLLSQIEYSDLLFRKMLESAKFRRFRTELMTFFSRHPGTKRWAMETEESMFSDASDEELPKRRIKD